MKVLYQNGTRALIIAFIAMIIAVVALVLTYLAHQPPTPGLCEYPSPRKILTTVKDVSGPAVQEKGIVAERAIRCVVGSPLLDVIAYRNFHNLDNNMIVVDLCTPVRDTDICTPGVNTSRARGTTSTDTYIQLPAKVTAGTWRLEGVDVVPKTGELRTWFSEQFEVVP